MSLSTLLSPMLLSYIIPHILHILVEVLLPLTSSGFCIFNVLPTGTAEKIPNLKETLGTLFAKECLDLAQLPLPMSTSHLFQCLVHKGQNKNNLFEGFRYHGWVLEREGGEKYPSAKNSKKRNFTQKYEMCSNK